MSSGFQPGASAGPWKREPSTTTLDTARTPARRAAAARSANRPAPSYSVGEPGPAADRVGSPAPTSTTSPGAGPATSRVTIRRSGGSAASTAAAVVSFAVEAGIAGRAAPRSSSTVPESASTTVATNRPPSLRSANGPASALATPAGLGAGCPPPSTPSTGPGAGTSGASGAGEPGAAV